MRTVARYFDLTEAQVARGALRAGGHGELLRDEYLGSLDWTYLIALGGLRLQKEEPAVPEPMLAKEFEVEGACPELEQYESPDWRRVRRAKWRTILVWLLAAPVAGLIALLIGAV